MTLIPDGLPVITTCATFGLVQNDRVRLEKRFGTEEFTTFHKGPFKFTKNAFQNGMTSPVTKNCGMARVLERLLQYFIHTGMARYCLQ